MSPRSYDLLLAAALLLPLPLGAQSRPPSNLVAAERARSRACVPELTRLAELNEALTPLTRRVQRLQALDRAVRMEDTTEAAPFDAADSLETAIRDWFEADQALGLRQAAGDSVRTERTAAREAIRAKIREAFQATDSRARGLVDQVGDVGSASRRCEGAILVRNTVLEVCDTVSSPVCDAARAPDSVATSPYRFVDSAVDLWSVEELRPWTDPTPLRRLPDGSLGGARTSALARHGNAVFVLTLRPLLQERSSLSEEEVAGYEERLDSLGLTFDDPRFVMAPALTVELEVPGPLGEETHYLLHFGDLSDPKNQVVWTGPVATGPFGTTFPAPEGALALLARGEPLSLTAVKVPEGGAEAQAVYSLQLPALKQAQAVSDLLAYMGNGGLERDLQALVPRATAAVSDSAGGG